MRILVIGAKGMLGQEFIRQLSGQDVVGWSREDLDITNETAVLQKVGELRPQVIINCAAYNNVDKAEDEPEVAMAINGEAVGYLARAAADCGGTLSVSNSHAERGAIFVHFSTDYVFEGGKTEGYREDDPPHPISIYGKSKALGEQRLGSNTHGRENLSPWYLIRTSKLFGPPGVGATSKKSFPEIMIKIAKEQGRVEAVDAEVGSPTYVKDLAHATIDLFPPLRVRGGEEGLRTIHNSPQPPLTLRGGESGIYHITNSGSCTWYEYAKAALEYAGLAQVPVIPVGPDYFPRKAKRPAHVVLLNTKLPSLRPWQDALKEFLG